MTSMYSVTFSGEIFFSYQTVFDFCSVQIGTLTNELQQENRLSRLLLIFHKYYFVISRCIYVLLLELACQPCLA